MRSDGLMEKWSEVRGWRATCPCWQWCSWSYNSDELTREQAVAVLEAHVGGVHGEVA